MDAIQFWLEDLRPSGDQALRCPACGGAEWTARTMDYGAELACWSCPAYIGIKTKGRTMAALSTGTYGKATDMPALTDFADRLTAILAAARAAVTELGDGIAIGAPVSQAHVNTLDKALQDLGELAVTARQAASDEAAQAASQPDAGQAAPQQGTAKASGTSSATTGSGTGTGSGKA